jgi:hypothetical protein
VIVVPIPQEWGPTRSPALSALRMEGLEVRAHLCASPLDYGRLFTELWNAGKKFVIVEHDIVPSPGVVEALLGCPAGKHCTHQYPLHQGNLAISFGIGKYDPVAEAPADWASTPWRLLDGAVLPVVRQRCGPPHVHVPPVAHARREVA